MAERGVSSKRSSGVRRTDMASTAPSVSFYQLTRASVVPERWTNENNFSITRLQSPFGIQNSIMKASRVKAMHCSPPTGYASGWEKETAHTKRVIQLFTGYENIYRRCYSNMQ